MGCPVSIKMSEDCDCEGEEKLHKSRERIKPPDIIPSQRNLMDWKMPSVTRNCKYTVFVASDLLAPSRVTPVLSQDRTLPGEVPAGPSCPDTRPAQGSRSSGRNSPRSRFREVRKTARQQGHIPAPSETRGHGQDTFLQVRVYSSFSRRQNPLFWPTNTMLTPKNDKKQTHHPKQSA